jgi:lipid-A-disaccharide synthase-like uncharacterized protein
MHEPNYKNKSKMIEWMQTQNLKKGRLLAFEGKVLYNFHLLVQFLYFATEPETLKKKKCRRITWVS